jgi:hypothetical protein
MSETVTEAASVTAQPPFVPEEGRVPLVVPATPAGMPPTAQAFFAVVSAAGALVRGFHAVSAAHLGTGVYQVLFGHDITGSAYIGTIGLTGSSAGSPPGQIAVVGRFGAPHGVFVQTFNATGTPTDLAFHLAVLS